ncbi:ABC transporter ATP-binding protein [Micromonospora sp. NBC_01813]|uniref:ABC transporter ATP-binding protein n=1 Tax=Micromonospora sp. NBC_01813 TaxID=2975988 RepID=UPI002DDBBD6C|nr:ABC transporter ATP-binding protein [Micromonospora sp. NBC_01813]WSA07813.1 ABC transporter ATP-binding protein [Micromonospora sp. NBC_01813]
MTVTHDIGASTSSSEHTVAAAGGESAAEPAVESAVVLAGVRKRYGDVQAVDGISLTIRRGEFFGILGPNGAGKTTLIEIVEGLRQADAGTIQVLGMSPWPRNVALLPRLGLQTQKSAFFARLTAREHLETVAALYGLPATAAGPALELVGLTGQADKRVGELSGGQRQRLAIAGALIHEPELVFLDEPTAALDTQARRDLWQVLRSLKAQGRTIIYTTHHLDEAEALCDRVAIVVAGSVIALDTPHRLVGAARVPTRVMVPVGRISIAQAEALPGVGRVTVEGGSVVLETTTAGATLAAVGELIGLDEVQTRTATLEDVYLELTGSETH